MEFDRGCVPSQGDRRYFDTIQMIHKRLTSLGQIYANIMRMCYF